MTDTLFKITVDLGDCRRCGLCETRSNIVFGDGDGQADWMFIGEAPGENEDQQGLPFVGRSGDLLTEMLGEAGVSREDVFITNVVCCRPPKNRDPLPEEVAACRPFLFRKIEVVKPVVITTLGRVAAQLLLDTNAPMRDLRGQTIDFMGAKVVPAYHPSYILRSGGTKKDLFREDLGLALATLVENGVQL